MPLLPLAWAKGDQEWYCGTRPPPRADLGLALGACRHPNPAAPSSPPGLCRGVRGQDQCAEPGSALALSSFHVWPREGTFAFLSLRSRACLDRPRSQEPFGFAPCTRARVPPHRLGSRVPCPSPSLRGLPGQGAALGPGLGAGAVGAGAGRCPAPPRSAPHSRPGLRRGGTREPGAGAGKVT